MDIQEIEVEIKRLEQEDNSYQNLSKLAVLYSIKDHYRDNRRITGYSYASSEFLNAVANAPIDGVLDILNEHMDAVKLLYPKEYSVIINKVRSL